MTPSRTKYTVPDMEDAHELGRMAAEAIEAAREGFPNQRQLADQLFRAIYGARHLTAAELEDGKHVVTVSSSPGKTVLRIDGGAG